MQCYNQVVNLHCYLHISSKQKPKFCCYSVLNIKNVRCFVAVDNEYEALKIVLIQYHWDKRYYYYYTDIRTGISNQSKKQSNVFALRWFAFVALLCVARFWQRNANVALLFRLLYHMSPRK